MANAFISAILGLIQNPQLPAFVLGAFVPFVYRELQEGGLTVPSKVKVWLNIGLSFVVSLVPLIASWVSSGLPDAETVFASLTAAFLASEIAYRTYLKPKKEAASGA